MRILTIIIVLLAGAIGYTFYVGECAGGAVKNYVVDFTEHPQMQQVMRRLSLESNEARAFLHQLETVLGPDYTLADLDKLLDELAFECVEHENSYFSCTGVVRVIWLSRTSHGICGAWKVASGTRYQLSVSYSAAGNIVSGLVTAVESRNMTDEEIVEVEPSFGSS